MAHKNKDINKLIKYLMYTPYLWLSIFLYLSSVFFSSAALIAAQCEPKHIDAQYLSEAIRTLNSGDDDAVFIPLELSNNYKKFLQELELLFSDDNATEKHGKVLTIQGDMSDNNFQIFTKKAEADLVAFFSKHTNASIVGNKYGLDGPRYMSRLLLEYAANLLHEFNALNAGNESNVVHFYIKALKANNSFNLYKRWHYDSGGATEREVNANVNLAGVFTGPATLFVASDKETKKLYRTIVANTFVREPDVKFPM